MAFTTDSKTLRFFSRYWPLTFVIMVLSFLCFGALTVNLTQVLLANISFLSEYGLVAVMEGAFTQLLGLIFKAGLAVAFYVVFKSCESVLVQRLLADRTPPVRR